MATLRYINFIHNVCFVFPTDLQHSSPCQHHSSFMSIISSYNLTALTPAFSLLKLPPSGTAVLYLSTSFTCHLCTNLSWKHSFFPLPPVPFSLVLFSSTKQSCTWPRTRLVCKMLQTLSSPQSSYLWIRVAFKGTKKCVQDILKHVSYLMELKPNPQASLGGYTYTDNNGKALQTFEGMILHGYLVTRVKLRGGKKNWEIIIVISQILCLKSNFASNAIL